MFQKPKTIKEVCCYCAIAAATTTMVTATFPPKMKAVKHYNRLGIHAQRKLRAKLARKLMRHVVIFYFGYILDEDRLPGGIQTLLGGMACIYKRPHKEQKLYWRSYFTLCKLVKGFFEAHFEDEFPPEDNLGTDITNWNLATWLSVMTQFMEKFVAPPIKHGCWKLKRQHLKITLGEMVFSNQGWRFTCIEGIQYKSCKPCRFVGVLADPTKAALLYSVDRNQQWCHRCYNLPQNCCSPFHGYFESDKHNKSMQKCVNGAAFYCPHVPKCIFVDERGARIPCRNLQEFPTDPCTHEPNCHSIMPGARL